jgi:hypothetical protein
MFRKLALAIIAVASIAAAAPASAFGGGHGGGHFGGGHFGGGHFGGHHFGGGFHRFHGGGVYIVGGSCWRTVWTDFGPRRVYVCD